MPLLDTLAQIGAATIPSFWIPVIAWTGVAALVATLIRTVAERVDPRLTLIATLGLLLALPIGFVLGQLGAGMAVVDFEARQLLPHASGPGTPAEVPGSGHTQLSDLRQTSEAAAMATATRKTTGGAVPKVRPTQNNQVFLLVAAIGFSSLVVLACAIWKCIRLIVQLGAVQRIRRRLTEVSDSRSLQRLDELKRISGVRRHVTFVSGRSIPPMTFGAVRPVVVVPDLALEDDAVLRCAVTHELMHVRNHDYTIRLMLKGMLIPFAWHPLVEWLTRTAIDAREAVCDRLVVESGRVTVPEYAEALVRFAQYSPAPLLCPSLAVMRSKLARRISKMTHQDRDSVKRVKVLLLGTFVLVLSAAVTACSNPASEDQVSAEERVQILDREVDYLVTEFQQIGAEYVPLVERMNPRTRDSVTANEQVQFQLLGTRRAILREMLTEKLREREVARMQLAARRE